MYFLAVDAHSKWPEIYEMTVTTANKTIEVLRHLFARYGLPEQLVSDNGPQFTSDEFKHFCAPTGSSTSGLPHTIQRQMEPWRDWSGPSRRA